MERRRFGMRPGLDVMRAVLAELGNPQDALKVIHVAGTNGKGAVCAMLDAILRAADYRVARYKKHGISCFLCGFLRCPPRIFGGFPYASVLFSPSLCVLLFNLPLLP